MGSIVEHRERKFFTHIFKNSLWLIPLTLTGFLIFSYHIYLQTNSTKNFFDYALGNLWNTISNINDLLETEPKNEIKALSLVKSDNTVDKLKESIPLKTIKPKIDFPKLDKSVAHPKFTSLQKIKNEVGSLEKSQLNNQLLKIRPKQNILIDLLSGVKLSNYYNEDLKDKKESRFKVGFTISPNLSYRVLSYDYDRIGIETVSNQNYTMGLTKKFRNSTDKPLFSLSFSLQLNYALNKQWRIETGIGYYNYGEKLACSELESEKNPYIGNPSIFDKEPTFATAEDEEGRLKDNTFYYQNQYSFIQIPLILHYLQPLNQSSGLAFKTGVSFAYFDYADMIVFDYDRNNFQRIQGTDHSIINKQHLVAHIGLEYHQQIHPKIEGYVGANANQFMTSIFNDKYPVSHLINSLNLDMGLRLSL